MANEIYKNYNSIGRVNTGYLIINGADFHAPNSSNWSAQGFSPGGANVLPVTFNVNTYALSTTTSGSQSSYACYPLRAIPNGVTINSITLNYTISNAGAKTVSNPVSFGAVAINPPGIILSLFSGQQYVTSTFNSGTSKYTYPTSGTQSCTNLCTQNNTVDLSVYSYVVYVADELVSSDNIYGTNRIHSIRVNYTFNSQPI